MICVCSKSKYFETSIAAMSDALSSSDLAAKSMLISTAKAAINRKIGIIITDIIAYEPLSYLICFIKNFFIYFNSKVLFNI
ncbi:unnamed protein product [marine sediment metagenome]|uniref:Uncharacterized protein n=1 Tax=marine sediment metagenome TaxID=412755 RepID=X1BLQ7_9ZZZZ